MKSKQIKKQKKDKSRQKTKKLKQKQKQRQVQRQVVNVTSTSSGGSGGGYLQPQQQPLYAAPQTLESKIAEFKAIRQAINVNDRDPEEKNIQENAINKMDENNIYNNIIDLATQEKLQHQSGLKVPRFSFSGQKNKNISYQGLSERGSPVAYNISLDQISAEKQKQLIPSPPPKTPPNRKRQEPKKDKSEKKEEQKVNVVPKKPGPGRPKKNPTE
jgi:hypothetical protein